MATFFNGSTFYDQALLQAWPLSVLSQPGESQHKMSQMWYHVLRLIWWKCGGAPAWDEAQVCALHKDQRWWSSPRASWCFRCWRAAGPLRHHMEGLRGSGVCGLPIPPLWRAGLYPEPFGRGRRQRAARETQGLGCHSGRRPLHRLDRNAGPPLPASSAGFTPWFLPSPRERRGGTGGKEQPAL